MSTATIKRAPVRRAPPNRAKPVVMVRVPLAPRRFLRHAVTAMMVLVGLAVATASIVAGLPGRAWQATARSASRAGFDVRHVEVHGIGNGPRLAVVAAILEGPTNSMLLVDLGAARARLQALPWVADASVARRLPDTLIVDITERRAVALWQHRGQLAAIDATGVPLTFENLERFGALPLVVGVDANRRVGDLLTMLRTIPRLALAVDAATLVGGRRWDIRFKSGETLVLPEGFAARAALARFDELDRHAALLGHGYTRFDLRFPGKMTVRVGTAVKPRRDVNEAVAI